jgi:hypothetical protein
MFRNDDDLLGERCPRVSAYYAERLVVASIRKFPERWQQHSDLSGNYMECADVLSCSFHHLSACVPGKSQPSYFVHTYRRTYVWVHEHINLIKGTNISSRKWMWNKLYFLNAIYRACVSLLILPFSVWMDFLMYFMTHKILVRTYNESRPLGRPRCRWEDAIKMDTQELWCEVTDWVHLTHDRV